jgi:hypothetical protein
VWGWYVKKNEKSHERARVASIPFFRRPMDAWASRRSSRRKASTPPAASKPAGSGVARPLSPSTPPSMKRAVSMERLEQREAESLLGSSRAPLKDSPARMREGRFPLASPAPTMTPKTARAQPRRDHTLLADRLSRSEWSAFSPEQLDKVQQRREEEKARAVVRAQRMRSRWFAQWEASMASRQAATLPPSLLNDSGASSDAQPARASGAATCGTPAKPSFEDFADPIAAKASWLVMVREEHAANQQRRRSLILQEKALGIHHRPASARRAIASDPIANPYETKAAWLARIREEHALAQRRRSRLAEQATIFDRILAAAAAADAQRAADGGTAEVRSSGGQHYSLTSAARLLEVSSNASAYASAGAVVVEDGSSGSPGHLGPLRLPKRSALMSFRNKRGSSYGKSWRSNRASQNDPSLAYTFRYDDTLDLENVLEC